MREHTRSNISFHMPYSMLKG